MEINGLRVEVVRKNIKNLHLALYPPDGRVRISVPLRLSDEDARQAVISRLGWIRRNQAKFASQDRQLEHQMVSGECHYLQGRSYHLDVIEITGKPSVRVGNNHTLEVRVKPDTTRQDREAVLLRWYRDLLREQVPNLIAKWEPVIGVDVAEWRIKSMKTRWGTCNIAASRIWLSLELAKKPQSCLEYVVVHEMVHLLERRHNDRFWEYMGRFMPQWRLQRDELNRAPLSHEDWTY